MTALDPTLGVFTIPPDWGEGNTEYLAWLTSITESPQAVEQRMGLRISPRQMFEYSYVVFNRRRTHLDILNMAIAGSPFYLPIWHDKATLTALANPGATVLSLDTQYTEFQNCTVAVLMANEFDYELVEVQSFTNNSLTLTLGLTRLWPAGSVIYPCKKVRVESQLSGERHADEAFRGRMRFQSLETNDSNAEFNFSIYLDNPVLEDEPNEAGSTQYNYDRKEYLLDMKVGLQLLSDVASFVNQNHNWFAKGRQRAWRLRGLLYALQGRRRPIWIPSFFADFELVESDVYTSFIESVSDMPLAPLEGAPFDGPGIYIQTPTPYRLKVYRCGFSDAGGPFSHRDHILIHMRNGSRIYRKILSSTVSSEGSYELLELDSPPNVNLTPDNVLRISFLTFCRLDQDTIELVHHSDSRGVTTANLVWRTDPGISGNTSETTFDLPPFSPPDPSVQPIYDPFRTPTGKLWQYTPSFATFSGSDYVGIWWAGRRTAAELIADNPQLPANVDDAFPSTSISGSGAFVTLPMTGSFLVRIGLYWNNMGWPNPTVIHFALRYIGGFMADLVGDFGGVEVDPDFRYTITTQRTEIAPNMIDPDTPIQLHLEYKFEGGVNAQPICNPLGDCTPYHGSASASGGDSYWIIEWWP